MAEITNETSDLSAPLLLKNPNAVAASCGKVWWSRGFEMFKRDPGVWVGVAVLFMVVTMGLTWITDGSMIIGLAVQAISTVLYGGLLFSCRAVERGEPMTISYLFACFQHRLPALLGIGVLYTVAFFVVATVGALGAGLGALISQSAIGAVVMSLLLLVILVGLGMAFWFAPVLLVMHDELSVVEALKLSFAACIENLGALTVYGLIFMGLAILATLLFGLGWLVLLPVSVISVYFAYKDLFLAWPPSTQDTGFEQ